MEECVYAKAASSCCRVPGCAVAFWRRIYVAVIPVLKLCFTQRDSVPWSVTE